MEKNNFIDNERDRILLVDDEPLVRNTVSRYLARSGFEIDTAEDGKVALEKLAQNTYDLVLTDLKMPNLDGRELLKVMADKYPDVPRIVLTGFGEDKDILIALKAGASDFLYKPIGDFEILQHSVSKALEIKKLSREKDEYFEQIKQTNEIISMLNQGKKTEEIFQALSITLKKIIPFKRLSLAIKDDKNNTAVVKLTASDKGIEIPDNGLEIPLETPVLLALSENPRFALINDFEELISHLPHTNIINILLEGGIQSCLMMSLIINNEIRGYLIFLSDRKDIFKKTHITLLESIVGQIALSIQRGELLGDLELHTQELERLVDIRTKEILKIQRTTTFALSNLAEMRDLETGEHLERIRKYSILTAQIYKYSANETKISNLFLRDLYDSSILHDIGKVGIPDMILLKPGPLTPEETEIMKTHTTIAYNALKSASMNLGDNPFLNMAMDIILFHHERWDGTGYPIGLKGEEIPLSARLVMISDIYDALTSKRPYKEAFSHEKAVEIMKKQANYFDPVLFKIFIENSDEYNTIKQQFPGGENTSRD